MSQTGTTARKRRAQAAAPRGRGAARRRLKKAEGLKKVPMTTRETSDLIMMGIGAFTPLDGFMGQDDWKGVCDDYKMPSKNGLFWPIPITLSADQALADSIADRRGGRAVGHRDRRPHGHHEGDREVHHRQGTRVQAGLHAPPTTEHPGVQKVMEPGRR